MHGIVSPWRNYALPGVVASRFRLSTILFILSASQFSGVPIKALAFLTWATTIAKLAGPRDQHGCKIIQANASGRRDQAR